MCKHHKVTHYYFAWDRQLFLTEKFTGPQDRGDSESYDTGSFDNLSFPEVDRPEGKQDKFGEASYSHDAKPRTTSHRYPWGASNIAVFFC